MRISEYSLLDSSYGNGYIDDPYEFYNLYVRGGSAVSWTVEGKGRFSLNLTDMYQRVYEEDAAYHAISIFVNGELVQADNSFLEETQDYGVTIELTEDVSEVKLQFSSNLNKTGNLTYVRKLSSFLLEKKPVISEETSTTTTLEPVLSEENRIKADGMRIASVDLDSSCGPYSIVVTPDTGDFHYIDGELWFDGDKSIEREWRVCVKAINTAGDTIGGKCFTFTVSDCDSSGACVIVDDPSNPGGPGGPSRPGGPGTGNPDIDDPDVDPDIPAPTGGTSGFNSCGPRADDDSGAIFSNWTLSWPSSSVDQLLYDFQLSKGNTFNLIDLQYLAITASELDVLVDEGVTYFFRIRARTADSSRVSEWSDEFMFESSSPNPSDPCSITQEDPDAPDQAPIICRDGIPTDPNEPGTNPIPNPNPNPNPLPTDPTNPGGPGQCFGNGCGDDDDPNNPNNPNGPNNPNPPGRFPTDPGSPGGCIGPGCSPGSGPGGDGDTGGNGPGPGGPTNPNPKDPVIPRPKPPKCGDDKIRKSFLTVTNESTNVINVEIKFSSNKSDSCVDYLQSIGKASQEILTKAFVDAGQTKNLDLKFTCPECIDICVTSPGGGDPFSWIIFSSEIDKDGKELPPEEWKATSESTVESCDCNAAPLTDSFNAQNYDQGGVKESTSMERVSPNHQFAIKRPIGANEDCYIVTQVQETDDSYQQRSKLLCFECGSDNEWIETTSALIGCEVGFFRRYPDDESDSTPKLVSYPNHWAMSSLTHEYGRQAWPETKLLAWKISSKAFRTNWGLENDLCVTCCETGTSPTGFTYLTGGLLEGDYGAGPNSPGRPYNNILCTDGIIDPNMGGHTGSETADNKPQSMTYAGPCSPVFVTSTNIRDGLNSVANNFYGQSQQFGFSEVTQAEVNAMLPGVACNSYDNDKEYGCSKVAIRSDYTYTKGTYARVEDCQYNGAGEDKALYGLIGKGTSVNIGVNIVPLMGISTDCQFPNRPNGHAEFKQKGVPPNSIPGKYEVPMGVNFNDGNQNWWMEENFRIQPGSNGPDGRRWDSGRFGIDIVMSAHVAGVGGSNPLP